MKAWQVKLLYSLSMFSILILTLGLSGAGLAQSAPQEGFRALKDAQAAAFKLPNDVRLVTSFDLPRYGLTYERYQQVFGPAGAEVLGGQLTLLKEGSATRYVIGAHYPAIRPGNAVNLTAAQARQRATHDVGAAGQRITTLMINPGSGRYFYRVETRRADARWFHWIDAGDGALLNKFNAIMYDCDVASAPCGYGVQYTEDTSDVKDLSSLTTGSGGNFQLISTDGRQETHDQGSSRRPFLGPVATDSDNAWVAIGDVSPAQQALVDAQYYANVTDDYYLGVHGYDWVAAATAAGANDRMEIHAHYSSDYNNAFWSGSYIALGDGDQATFRELTALDVVGHELTHGVTDFTSGLIYQDESGALNEAFSDMMGSSMEFWADTNSLEPAASIGPDWFIGEDVYLPADTYRGFRNMADPNEDGDPSHYDDRYTGTSDNGGVHTNSGIANHWYYLLINGGQNANTARASGSHVQGIGLAAAEPIAFLGFTALPADASFCDARASTIAVAGGNSDNAADAWDEVGVNAALCDGGTTDNPPSVSISSPSDGATVSGSVTIKANASDDNGVSQVEFFIDGSSIGVDGDGSDGWSASWDTTSPYADGSYTVSATATDTANQTASDSVSVTVDNTADGITLSATGYKVRGLQKADLSWSGASSADVDIYRDGSLIVTTANDNSFTDNIDQRGSGSYTYLVCEAGTKTCSKTTTVNF
jgi:bacillolysin